MPTCAHSGCKREFSAEENNATACQYHPGTPVFHEGFKSWSCCNKKRASFEEFMAEPGCTLGFHEIEPENTKGSKVKLETPEKHDEIQVMKESDKRKINKKDESYKTSDLSKEFTNIKVDDGEKVEKTPVLQEDPEDAEIAPGTCCRRKGCGKSFIDNNTSRDPSSQDSICIYHSGVPVFHEGSKGWSCCKPKVLDFDDFLKIAGCSRGKHLFTNPIKKEDAVQCRTDFYQTPDTIILSIFGKNVDSSLSEIQFLERELKVRLMMPGNKVYADRIALFSNINPEESSFKFFSTKVDLYLKKVDPISWPSLGPTENITTWTTFGKGDSPLPEVTRNK